MSSTGPVGPFFPNEEADFTMELKIFNTSHAGGNSRITNVNGVLVQNVQIVQNIYTMPPDQGTQLSRDTPLKFAVPDQQFSFTTNMTPNRYSKPPPLFDINSTPGNHIPRPPNAFILFRSSFIKNEHVFTEVETNPSTLSKIIGRTWQNLPKEERQVWHGKAKAALEDHKRCFPSYTFRPAHGATVTKKRKGGKVGLKNTKRCGSTASDFSFDPKIDPSLFNFDSFFVEPGSPYVTSSPSSMYGSFDTYSQNMQPQHSRPPSLTINTSLSQGQSPSPFDNTASTPHMYSSTAYTALSQPEDSFAPHNLSLDAFQGMVDMSNRCYMGTGYAVSETQLAGQDIDDFALFMSYLDQNPSYAI